MSRPPYASLHMYRRLGLTGYFNYLVKKNGLESHPQLNATSEPTSNHEVEDWISTLLSPGGPSTPPSNAPKFDPNAAPPEEEAPSSEFDPDSAAPEENPFPEAVQQYDSWTLAELREECKDRSLPIYGTKAEIALRLKQNDLPPATDEIEAPVEETAAETKSEAPSKDLEAATNGEILNDEQPNGDTK